MMPCETTRLRYQVEKSLVYDGKWSVIDTFTGCAEIVEGVPLDCLTAVEAKDLVNLMNGRELRAKGVKLNP
ncbi:hypothetical protein SAMN05216228_103453 [Rhizobium tibeticum]|uniref:Uncharacterized protein n=1 Tax=Rhizobium tibeticum TaxID=501024 RepID=A0A1H8UIS6_9HYPH|nr:hypothetical protein RTCCBAU85039_5590 [Rhizobium tibeticum]SEP03061.1 hypothetical protein SAMN05216228_103453 [Rhizobium tibeticum]